jgi:glyoxylase-like metal-dependent hydrolase (beta-lactamase superfamily II)
VVAGEKAPEMFANEKVNRQFISMHTAIAGIMADMGEIPEAPRTLDEYIFPVDETVGEGGRIALGEGVCWTAYTAPGHSPCSIAWREETEGILAVGDALGFYSPELDTFWPNYFDSLPRYCDSIRKLAALPAELLALSHNGVITGDTLGFFRRALSVTEAYHREMVGRVGKGEDPRAISREKADWVHTISDHMPYEMMAPFCGLLIKRSRTAEALNPELSFKL